MRLAEVKERVPIGNVLRHYGWDGEYRGGGEWRRIRCPFHRDNNPSASLNTKKGRFNCFTCGVRGDILDIVMQQEGFSRVKDAADWITRRF